MLERPEDPLGDPLHLVAAHAAGRERRRAEADARGIHWLPLVVGNHVLVAGDSAAVERLLGDLAADAQRRDVHQHQVVVGAAADEPHAAGGERLGKHLRVRHDLLRIRLELGPQGLAEGHRLAGDHMHQGTALLAGEHRPIEILGVGLAAHRDPAARAAERFVGRAGHEVGHGHGVVVDAGGDEARIVSHVDQEFRAHLPRDLGERPVGDLAGIRARPGHDQLRLVLAGEARHLVEVEPTVVATDAVVDELVEHARGVELHAVREVAAMGKVEGQHGVARLDRGEIDRRVGLAAGVGLHVHVLGAEQALEPVAGDVFHLVDELAAAVVPPAGIALGILVGEYAAHRLHHRRAREVLAGDHLEAFLLPHLLGGDGRPDLGILEFHEVGGDVHRESSLVGTGGGLSGRTRLWKRRQ